MLPADGRLARGLRRARPALDEVSAFVNRVYLERRR